MSRGGSGTRGRRRLERQPRGDHSAHVEDGHVESGFSRGSSFKKSVSGLVRRVSQRVTRENKGIQYLTQCSISNCLILTDLEISKRLLKLSR